MGQDCPRSPGGLYINSGGRLEVLGEGKDPNPTDSRLMVFASFLQSGSELGMVDEAAVGPGPHVRQRAPPHRQQQPFTWEARLTPPFCSSSWPLEARLRGEPSQLRRRWPDRPLWQTDRQTPRSARGVEGLGREEGVGRSRGPETGREGRSGRMVGGTQAVFICCVTSSAS